jgi:hypothetical protein
MWIDDRRNERVVHVAIGRFRREHAVAARDIADSVRGSSKKRPAREPPPPPSAQPSLTRSV